jgi:hypothetical protein
MVNSQLQGQVNLLLPVLFSVNIQLVNNHLLGLAWEVPLLVSGSVLGGVNLLAQAALLAATALVKVNKSKMQEMSKEVQSSYHM